MKWNIVKTISGETDWYFRGEQVYLGHHYIVEGPLYGIARVSGETQEEAHSHARLIAAAPDLLAALNRIHNNASARRDNCRSDVESRVYAEIAQEARAAIAKTKGQTHES